MSSILAMIAVVISLVSAGASYLSWHQSDRANDLTAEAQQHAMAEEQRAQASKVTAFWQSYAGGKRELEVDNRSLLPVHNTHLVFGELGTVAMSYLLVDFLVGCNSWKAPEVLDSSTELPNAGPFALYFQDGRNVWWHLDLETQQLKRFKGNPVQQFAGTDLTVKWSEVVKTDGLPNGCG